MSHTYEWPRPSLTTDICIFDKSKVLVFTKPNSDKFYLAGGHLEPGETLLQCAKRELIEETSIDASTEDLHFVKMFDEPFRDDRGWKISALFFLKWNVQYKVEAKDDVDGFQWLDVYKVIAGEYKFGWDHKDMIEAAVIALGVFNLEQLGKK